MNNGDRVIVICYETILEGTYRRFGSSRGYLIKGVVEHGPYNNDYLVPFEETVWTRALEIQTAIKTAKTNLYNAIGEGHKLREEAQAALTVATA